MTESSQCAVDFGALPWGCQKCRSVTLVNRGRANVPVRLIISSVRLVLFVFILHYLLIIFIDQFILLIFLMFNILNCNATLCIYLLYFIYFYLSICTLIVLKYVCLSLFANR